MNFLYGEWFFLALAGAFLYGFFVLRYERAFFQRVEKYWFFFPSPLYIFKRAFYFSGCLLLALSLLDLRGREEKVESKIPDQKTLILIDASASMLTEDVRPNRFQKALLMARHFIKNAVGHKIALVLFSDTQKQLLPFTDDIDLLDSRVAALEDVNLGKGSSKITQSLMESLSYFKIQSGKKEIEGNILLFTDTEENHEAIKLDFPKNMALAMVALGTFKGGPVPVKNQEGSFKGYKIHKGKKVISRVDKNWIEKISRLVKNFRYWMPSTYAVPTEEIIQFFKNFHKEKLAKGLVRIQPVKAHYLLIPAILSLSLAYIFGFFRLFSRSAFLFLFLSPFLAQAKENLEKLQQRHKKGFLEREDSLKLAEKFLEKNEYKAASTLYEENIKEIEDTEPEVLMNYGVSLAKSNQTLKAMKVFSELSKKLKDKKYSNFSKEDLRQNILLALRKSEEEKKSKSKEKNNEEKKSENRESKNQSQKRKERDQKNKGKENSEKKLDEKEAEIKKKREKIKIPAILKQILNKDRKLQKKMIDTKTKKPKNYEEKDW